MTTLIPLPVAVPLIVAAFIAFVGQWAGRRFCDTLSILTAGAMLWVTAVILRGVWLHPVTYWFGNWWPRANDVVLGICFRIDAIGAVIAVLVTLLTTAGLVYSWRIFEETENHFQPLMLIFMAAMCGFSYTGDLFNLFVFFELMSVSAFALCGLKTLEPAPLQGAYNFAIVNTVGAFMIVLGIGLLYGRTGALNFAQIGHSLGTHADALVILAFLLISVGFMGKAAIVPFHFWLADAHAVAPTPVCVLFSGVMVELGIYAVARIYWTVFHSAMAMHTEALRDVFMVMAAITCLLGGFMCYANHHLKRLLAFSTIGHAGLMLVGIGLLTPKGLAGFLLYALSHGVIKGGLFLCAGLVLHRLEKIGEDHLHGQGRHMWPTAVLFLLGAWGLAGCWPFGTLLGESMISEAAVAEHQNWVPYLFIFVEAITAGAVLRVFFRVFLGWGEPAPTDEASQVEEKPETEEHGHTPMMMLLPAAALVLLGISLIAVPGIRTLAEVNAERFVDQAGYAQDVLHEAEIPAPEPKPQDPLESSLVRTSIAGLLALGLALGSVFRKPLGGVVDFTRNLELGNSLLRRLHSGHPGDYVAWLSAGTALLGGSLMWLLR
ncbi:MAG TPA: proton-conducting transporter membrane subunit [Candidatus Sulfotelmatobacter sp.]|nr:proton-conducting transporter membrane subunit [Candidatus Sulfotelmatobacter sp.]